MVYMVRLWNKKCSEAGPKQCCSGPQNSTSNGFGSVTSIRQIELKGKGKAEHLYSALHGIQTTLKRSGVDHTVLPAINTMPAVYLVSD